MLSKILAYFFRGVLIVFPIGLTLFIIGATLSWLDELLSNLMGNGLNLPGSGIVLGFLILTIIGFLFSRYIPKQLFAFLESVIVRIPLISLVYNALKDFLEAFVGDKKKFTEPVLVKLNEQEVYKVGFITRKNISALENDDLVAVYFPHSYNFSGNLFIVHHSKVKPLDADASEIMKFTVTGGVSGLDSPPPS